MPENLPGSLKDKVVKRISEILRVPTSRLVDEAELISLVTESFVLVEMIIELQEEFQFRLNQEDLAGVKTVGQLLDLVCAKVEA